MLRANPGILELGPDQIFPSHNSKKLSLPSFAQLAFLLAMVGGDDSRNPEETGFISPRPF